MQSIDKQTKIAGEDYTLRFSWKAVAALGDRWGCATPDATLERLGEIQKKKALDLADAGDLLWAALQTHHPEVTRQMVDDMLDAHGIGGMAQLVADLSAAVSGAQPQAVGKPGPTRAKRGN